MTVNFENRGQAARFLYYATYGPKEGEVDQLMAQGPQVWLEDQFKSQPELHLAMNREYAEISGISANEHGRSSVWWHRVMNARDQLRQRMAYGLSQIFVVSPSGGPAGEALAAYYDLLLEHAFGNFRDLLEAVTLSPAMGSFLTMEGSRKANPSNNSRPDENYAREVMQLFTIGLWKLNSSGQLRLDSNGRRIPVYTQQDVEELARVFTGWRRKDYYQPMYGFTNWHDTEEKTVLGEVFPAGQTAEQDLSQAMDLLFNHPNTPQFVATLLIRRFTISNPRRVYINRVVAAFKDNGQGVRGDLKAVLKAILLDDDVLKRRGMSDNQKTGRSSTNFGKLKEPVIAMANLARGLEVKSNDSKRWWDFPGLWYGNNFGQSPLRANSVFNFYEPDYAPKGEIHDLQLVAPEFKILSMGVARTINNRMWEVIYRHNGSSSRKWHWDRSPFEQKVDDIPGYLNLLNERFYGGLMSSELSQFLTSMLETGEANGYSKDRKIRDTLFAVQCSPEFRCQG